jgi:hypothetical protein
MQVQIAIGENHRFELREALLVYYGNQTTLVQIAHRRGRQVREAKWETRDAESSAGPR